MKVLKENLIKLTTEMVLKIQCMSSEFMDWNHGNKMKNHLGVLTVKTLIANI